MIILLLVFIQVIPLVASAATGGDYSGYVANPLRSVASTIPGFISEFLKVMVKIGLPIVAMFLLIAGFKFASAGGSSTRIDEAKENFKYVIIGACLILGAWVLATLIGNTVTQVVGS